MEIDQLKNQCSKLVEQLDQKFGIERDVQLCFTQLMEEIGELAKEINKPKLRNKEIDIENLNGEFADVFIQLFALAQMHDINIEEALNSKIKNVKERYLNVNK